MNFLHDDAQAIDSSLMSIFEKLLRNCASANLSVTCSNQYHIFALIALMITFQLDRLLLSSSIDIPFM